MQKRTHIGTTRPAEAATRTDTIDVVSGADEHYALPLATMLHSLLSNVDSRSRVNLYLLDGGFASDTRRRLTDLIEQNRTGVRVSWVTPDLSAFVDVQTHLSYLSPIAYARLMLPGLLPEVHRAIYVDADLIVRGDLKELWDTDLNGAPIGAVQDVGVPVVSAPYGIRAYRDLGLDSMQQYFNIGVMVIDVDAWREEHLGERALQYLNDYADTLQIGDQEALNVAAQDRWCRLDPKWNVTTELFKESRTSEYDRLHDSVKDSESAWALADSAKIVHYTSERKPWDPECNHPLRGLFREYLYESGWLKPGERRKWKTRYWLGRAWRWLRVRTRSLRSRVSFLHGTPG